MGSKTGNWEGLRKQARALENEIDLKLVSFSKLGTNYSRAATTANSDSDKQPLLGGAESGLESLESDLESLLSQLSAINDEMAGYAAGAGDARSAAIHHTLQRHSEILQVRMAGRSSVLTVSFFCAGLQAGVQQDFQQHRQHVGEGGTAQLSPVGHFSLQERARGRQEESEDRQSSAGAGAHQVMLWAGRLSAGVK